MIGRSDYRICFLALAFIQASCNPLLEKKELEKLNPTDFVFPGSLQEVRGVAMNELGKMEEFADSPVFKQITEVLGNMALAWGKSLGDTFRAIGPEGIKNAILGFVSGLATVAKVIVALSSFVGGVMTTIGGIVGSVGKVLSFFHVSIFSVGIS